MTREQVSGINPRVLVWARERSGQSIQQVAEAMDRDPEVIASWEAGASAPTYVQLEMLAYRVYKRPVALFFFPEPPEEIEPERSFRTLPDFEIDDLSSDTRYRIRDARAMQLSLHELNAGFNPSPRKIFRDISASSRQPLSATSVALEVRDYLGVDLQTQKEWRNSADALKHWRNAVEEVGVFVFKNSFKQRDVSGFCLYDEEFPVICLNNSTAVTRQIFTLFHELAHVLVQTSGVTKADDRYIGALAGEAKRIEVFCNRFAAELLVPEPGFRRRVSSLLVDEDAIAGLAEEYKVSREVILRRLLDLDIVSKTYYEEKVAQWREEYASRSGKEGGNYYATQATYLGEKYLRLAFGRYYQGVISIQQLADFLNVRVSSVAGLEQFFLQQAAA